MEQSGVGSYGFQKFQGLGIDSLCCFGKSWLWEKEGGVEGGHINLGHNLIVAQASGHCLFRAETSKTKMLQASDIGVL